MSLHGTLLSTSEGSLGSNAQFPQSCSMRPQVSDNENPLNGDCLVSRCNCSRYKRLNYSFLRNSPCSVSSSQMIQFRVMIYQINPFDNSYFPYTYSTVYRHLIFKGVVLIYSPSQKFV